MSHKPPPWTPEQEAFALQMHKQGDSYTQIGRVLGMSNKTVGYRIRALQARAAHKQRAQPATNIVPPRRIMNSASREVYVPKQETPLRHGAMDYAAVRSRGI